MGLRVGFQGLGAKGLIRVSSGSLRGIRWERNFKQLDCGCNCGPKLCNPNLNPEPLCPYLRRPINPVIVYNGKLLPEIATQVGHKRLSRTNTCIYSQNQKLLLSSSPPPYSETCGKTVRWSLWLGKGKYFQDGPTWKRLLGLVGLFVLGGHDFSLQNDSRKS